MESTKPCRSAITLNGYRCQVQLGCDESERRIPQFVQFDVEVRFPRLPEGCKTDQLEHTFCYDRLGKIIQNLCEAREYRLIEKLGWVVYSALKESLPADAQIKVSTTKEKPPIPNLTNGATFHIGDWVY